MKKRMHQIIGRAEKAGFPALEIEGIPARVDTGAHTSAIWVSKVAHKDGRLGVVFFDRGSRFYTGEEHYFEAYERVIVISSNGHKEPRYKVKLAMQLAGKKIRARFTLADRSTQVYPVIIGRNVLRGKFIVDVTKEYMPKQERN